MVALGCFRCCDVMRKFQRRISSSSSSSSSCSSSAAGISCANPSAASPAPAQAQAPPLPPPKRLEQRPQQQQQQKQQAQQIQQQQHQQQRQKQQQALQQQAMQQQQHPVASFSVENTEVLSPRGEVSSSKKFDRNNRTVALWEDEAISWICDIRDEGDMHPLKVLFVWPIHQQIALYLNLSLQTLSVLSHPPTPLHSVISLDSKLQVYIV